MAEKQEATEDDEWSIEVGEGFSSPPYTRDACATVRAMGRSTMTVDPDPAQATIFREL